MSRRAAAVLAALALGSCGAPVPGDAPVPGETPAPGDAADRALAWLWAQQARDGLLRAEAYGVLRRGESVTAAALLATALLAPLDYPAYAAACHLHALCLLRPEGFERQSARRLEELRRLQHSPDNGWLPGDAAYGGFGLGDGPPRKPAGADLVTLSSTVTVLEAVRAAGVPADDPLVVAARRYVERCQQFGDGYGDRGGGFFAAPTDEWRGGKGGRDERGRKRAYGSATADGLRALLACGLPPEHPRLVAATGWLRRQGGGERDGARVPGLLPEFEPGLRFYWAAARARAAVDAAPALPAALLARQRDDGAFVGFSPAMKEDEPVVATILALFALSVTDA